MSGPFLFDDAFNLNRLAEFGGIHDFDSWCQFVFNGKSSFIGRPFSLATFTLNGQTWPTSPLPFKITNLAIHCFNAWLVFLFLKSLAALYARTNQITISNHLPLLGAALWLVHPIHISTILQVVQRMTLLSGTFILLSLIVYIKFLQNNPLKLSRNFFILISTLCFLGVLGILSKETVITVPLFMFALNYSVLGNAVSSDRTFKRTWQILLLVGPLAIFLVGSIYLSSGLEYLWNARDFTLTERVLTETRILFIYLSNIFIPTSSGSHLFHDDIVLSASFFYPISTLFSSIAIIALIITAIKIRSRMPFIALAILWFFLGHIFESTVWPLELYFEHRNYIPSLCLIFILIQISIEVSNQYHKLFIVCTSLYLMLTTLVTSFITPIWRDEATLFTNWAIDKPNSVRAQHAAAGIWLRVYNQPEKSLTYIETALANNPQSLATRISLLEHYCYIKGTEAQLNEVIHNLTNLQVDGMYLNAMSDLVTQFVAGNCKQLPPSKIRDMFAMLEDNPSVTNTAGGWPFYNKARFLLALQDYDGALTSAQIASQKQPYLGTTIIKLEIALRARDTTLLPIFYQEAIALEKEQFHLLRDDQKKLYEELKSLIIVKD